MKGRFIREIRRALAGLLVISAVKVTPKTDSRTLVAFLSLFEAMALEE